MTQTLTSDTILRPALFLSSFWALFFFSSQHRKCVRTPCESKYSMSVQSSLPLTTWCVSISALSISILQLYREGERESEQACVRHYVCFIIAVRRDAHSRHIWGVITSAGISRLSNGREQTWLRSASFVLDWAACKHHMLFVLWPHSPPPSFCNYFFFFITEHHNKQVAMCPLPSICLYWSGQ